ncbi:MAG: hypothetical protein DMG05_29890 [Acidobacteria bacterium]|nr:MAG: hypothetical protein DMG05_29890 [Acidobacteriota bacterium]
MWNRRRSRPRRHARLFAFEDEDDDEHDIPGYQGSEALVSKAFACSPELFDSWRAPILFFI